MEPIEFITPNKYKVLLKPQLTFGENNQIRSAVREQMLIEIKADPNKQTPAEEDIKMQPVSLASLMKANEIALKILVTKVFNNKDEDLGDPITAINNMPIVDGDAVMGKVDEITKRAEISKKKGI
jgi:hypothetical protein